jgi:multidrug efflux pump subunit AcrA (membrane-fusion protein)
MTGDKGKFVYVVEANNTVSPRPVTTSEWIDGNIIIENGITTEDKIATDGLPKLRPGSQVIPESKK